MPSAAPSTFAVTTPTRRPVYGPGPTPTAIPVRSRGDTPASAMILAIDGASSSAWRCASTVTSWASGWPPSWSATVTAGVAVSSPSSSTTNERSAPCGATDRAASALTASSDPVRPESGRLDRQTILAATWRATVCRGGGEIAHRHRPVLLGAGRLVEALHHRGDDDVAVADVNGRDVGVRRSCRTPGWPRRRTCRCRPACPGSGGDRGLRSARCSRPASARLYSAEAKAASAA